MTARPGRPAAIAFATASAHGSAARTQAARIDGRFAFH
jgi:hypothetical protein